MLATAAAASAAAAAAAKSLQLGPTLCDPVDCSPPGSPIPGILQARTLEWVAISFSKSYQHAIVKTTNHIYIHIWLISRIYTLNFKINNREGQPNLKWAKIRIDFLFYFRIFLLGIWLFEVFSLSAEIFVYRRYSLFLFFIYQILLFAHWLLLFLLPK